MKTHKQEMGVGAYQKAAIAAMKGAVISMLGQSASPGKESLTELYRPPVGSAEWYAEKTGEPLAPLMSHGTDNAMARQRIPELQGALEGAQARANRGGA